MKKAWRGARAAALLCSVSVSSVCYAQDINRSAADSGEIIVTARRVEERLQDVPISITVFNQKELTNRNVVNAQDLALYAPSLSASSSFGSANTSFAIRGFVQEVGTAPSVGVYFADVVAPRGPTGTTQAGDGAGPGSFFDLQNVQVLKGPQGTLFGRNTTGGAVLLVPQKPTDRLEGYVEGSYGNYDMKRLQGAINVPLGDTARLRVAADYMNRDGWLKSVSGIGPRDFNDTNYIAVRASLVADLTPDLENYIIATYLHSDTNGGLQKLIACSPTLGLGALLFCPQIQRERAAGAGFFDASNGIDSPRSLLEQWQLINTTTWRASDTFTVKNIASYAQLRNINRTSLFGTDLRFGIPPLGIPSDTRVAFASILPAPGNLTANQSTMSEELQFQGSSGDNRLQWQAGAYLEVSEPLGRVGNQVPSLLSCSNSAALQCTDVLGIAFSAASGFAFPVTVGGITYTSTRTSYRNVGTYAQATYELAEKLKVTGGIRYTWDRQTMDVDRYAFTFPVTPPFTQGPTRVCSEPSSAPSCSYILRQTSQKPTWLIGLDYKPSEDILLYAKYTRGYRAGGIVPATPEDFHNFGPEKVDAYEVGLKASFDGSVRGRFNVAGFYNDFTNQQVSAGFDPAPGAPVPPTTAITNSGTSRIYGAEVEGSLTLFEGLNLDASYTYLNATIREAAPIVTIDPNYVAQAQIAPGSQLFLSPKHRLTATARYTLPIDEKLGLVTFGATYSYSARQLTSYTYRNPVTLSGYGGIDYGQLPKRALLNLNFNWDKVAGSPVDLAVFATNVTNKKYYTFVPGIAAAGGEFGVLGEPRMYGLRLRYSFGL